MDQNAKPIGRRGKEGGGGGGGGGGRGVKGVQVRTGTNKFVMDFLDKEVSERRRKYERICD